MPGIIKNENESSNASREFDRKQVLKNTELNSQLGEEGRRIREQLRGQHQQHSSAPQESPESSPEPEEKPKRTFPKTKAPTAAKPSDNGFTSAVGFDEDDIENWNEQRGHTQKIVEPNTPYMGTAADTEYYDEDPVPDDLDLGHSAE